MSAAYGLVFSVPAACRTSEDLSFPGARFRRRAGRKAGCHPLTRKAPPGTLPESFARVPREMPVFPGRQHSEAVGAPALRSVRLPLSSCGRRGGFESQAHVRVENPAAPDCPENVLKSHSFADLQGIALRTRVFDQNLRARARFSSCRASCGPACREISPLSCTRPNKRQPVTSRFSDRGSVPALLSDRLAGWLRLALSFRVKILVALLADADELSLVRVWIVNAQR